VTTDFRFVARQFGYAAVVRALYRAHMPTPAEKKALLFLASVALLGASVRALRAVGAIEKAPAANARALDAQLDAVDSARGARNARPRAPA